MVRLLSINHLPLGGTTEILDGLASPSSSTLSTLFLCSCDKPVAAVVSGCMVAVAANCDVGDDKLLANAGWEAAGTGVDEVVLIVAVVKGVVIEGRAGSTKLSLLTVDTASLKSSPSPCNKNYQHLYFSLKRTVCLSFTMRHYGFWKDSFY